MSFLAFVETGTVVRLQERKGQDVYLPPSWCIVQPVHGYFRSYGYFYTYTVKILRSLDANETRRKRGLVHDLIIGIYRTITLRFGSFPTRRRSLLWSGLRTCLPLGSLLIHLRGSFMPDLS